MSGAAELTPFYDDGQIVIYCGDACEVLDALGSDFEVDITVTSPKYNMGLTPGGNGRGMYTHTTSKASRFSTEGYAGAKDDAMPHEAYVAWQRECLSMMFLRTKHAVFYNHRPRIIHGNYTPPLDGDFGHEGAEFQLRQIITWDRLTGIDVNLNHFCTRGEYIYLFARESFRLVDHAASGMGDIWRMGMETKVDHPAPFPVGLPARCIAASGATSVLDPFVGSGSTLVAARAAGIRGIGIDNKPEYCELAVKRVAQSSFMEAL